MPEENRKDEIFTSHSRCGEWGSISLERAQENGGESSRFTCAGTALNSKSEKAKFNKEPCESSQGMFADENWKLNHI